MVRSISFLLLFSVHPYLVIFIKQSLFGIGGSDPLFQPEDRSGTDHPPGRLAGAVPEICGLVHAE